MLPQLQHNDDAPAQGDSFRLSSSFRHSSELEYDGDVLQDAEELQSTQTSCNECRVHGAGLDLAIVRQDAVFTIEAFDGNGVRRSEGGDTFFVNIRGCGANVRARVIDNDDGTYLVRYRPEFSGAFLIFISLFGDPVPGSPFPCLVQMPTAVAAFCKVGGNSLHRAVARVQQTFEVQFKDALNHITHAEDLDVYVESVEQFENDGAHEAAPATAPADRKASGAREIEGGRPVGQSGGGASKVISHAAAQGQDERKTRVNKLPLLRTGEVRECVVISRAPLIVRSGQGLNSDRVGALRPGSTIYLIEIVEDRAFVAVDANEDDDAVGTGELGSSSPDALVRKPGSPTKFEERERWRDVYLSRPTWRDDDRLFEQIYSPRKSPRSPRNTYTPVGWVTIAKDGKLFVAARSAHLKAGERQRHMMAWSRRLAVDKSVEIAVRTKARHITTEPPKKKRGALAAEGHVRSASEKIFKNELSSDPKGIGFAFGGIEPGRLHARGRLIETHKVLYSVGKVGKYKLHVGLRKQMLPLPGSPFDLEVVPGPASALATCLPDDIYLPLTGTVGKQAEVGCHMTLQARDRMGNPCCVGGAKVTCSCSSEKIESQCIDNGDGTYALVWRTELSGTFDAKVCVAGEQILGSPFKLQLTSDEPDVVKTVASGPGLSKAQAGEPAKLTMQLYDRYSNVTVSGPLLSFGMLLVSKAGTKSEWKTAESDAFVGEWVDQAFQMTYQPENAGDLELYLWCDQKLDGEVKRIPIPQSPFKVNCVPGDASASGSFIDGMGKADAVNDKAAKKVATPANPQLNATLGSNEQMTMLSSGSTVGAGEIVTFMPQVRDRFGNATSAADGALSVHVVTPDSQRIPLSVVSLPKGSHTTYEARFEPKVKGDCRVDIALNGNPIKGSPVQFKVMTGIPDVVKSHFVVPPSPMFAGNTYTIKLVAVDKFGNECTSGGAYVTARLQSQNLPAGQDTGVEVIDENNGKYLFPLNIRAPADVKVMVQVMREKPKVGQITQPGAEFPPIALSFTSLKAHQAKEEREARKAGQTQAESDATQAAAIAMEKKKIESEVAAERKGKALAPLAAAVTEVLNNNAKAKCSQDKEGPTNDSKVILAEDALALAVEGFAEAGGMKREQRAKTLQPFKAAALAIGEAMHETASERNNRDAESIAKEWQLLSEATQEAKAHGQSDLIKEVTPCMPKQDFRKVVQAARKSVVPKPMRRGSKQR